MGTTATFDNAILADAVSKAARIAPRKGPAFDKAAGVLLLIDTTRSVALVRATDLDLYYEQTIPLLDVRGDSVSWRIPSSILQGITSNLPMGDNASVKFIDQGDPSAIRFKSDRLIAKLHMFPAEDFPRFEDFDLTGMTPAQQLANKVDQVAWATDDKSPVLSGIYMDGARIVGCNRYSLAVVPCVMALVEPIVVPLGILTQILQKATDIKVRATKTKFQISLDAETKAWCPVIDGQYPRIDSIMRTDFTGQLKVHKQQFLSTLDRMMVMVQNEKSPTLALEIDGTGLVKALTFNIEIAGTGRMQDTIDVSTDFSDVFKMSFVPKFLQDAVERVKGDYFSFDFGHPDPILAPLQAIRITDDQGFICYVVAKKGTDA